ncbi:hypothetical protein D3C76_1300730 [compost metagenome]
MDDPYSDAVLYRPDHVPAADGGDHLAAFRQLRHRQPDTGTDFLGPLAVGARHERDPRRRQRYPAAVPGAAVAVELNQDRGDHGDRHRDPLHHLRLRLCPYAFSRQEHAAEKHADFPDVPGGAVAGGVVRLVRSSGPIHSVYRFEHPRRGHFRLYGRHRAARLDHQGLFRNHR